MSMHPCYYVGPYITCETQAKSVIYHSIGCTNKTCLRHSMELDSKFCPDCGCATGFVSKQVNEPMVCTYTLSEGINETLISIEISTTQHCWIPNVRRNNPREFHLDYHDLASRGVVEIKEQAAEILWFTKMFATELALVEAAYGQGKVAIRWGILWEWR